jgi:flagellar hook-associated protein 1 FlgK
MSILGILEIGRTALTAQKAAIEVTGENIANVNTPGYSRQTAMLETAPFGTDQTPPVGSGVVMASVQRAYDRFLQLQINGQTSTNGEQSTEQTALQRVQSLFNDLSSEGLGSSLQSFFSAWQDLSMNPQGTAERQGVLSKAQTLIDNFHQISSSLNTVKQDANQSLGPLISDINNKTKQIAELNIRIREATQNNGSANALLDSRDKLIKDLAQKVGVTTLQQLDGTVSVSLAGGPQLVDGDKSAVFSLQQDPANPGMSSVMLTLWGGGAATDVTSVAAGTDGKGGELGGALKVRDSLANGFLGNLDELAYALANKVNGLHSSGFDLNGTTGINFFSPQPAPVPPATYTTGFSSAISLNITSTDNIAAASSDPTLAGNGSGNNVTSLNIADLKNLAIPLTGGSTTLTGYYNSLVGKVGTAVQTSDEKVAQNTAVLTQLNTLRESTSGVSLDEELTGLIKYQKAFQGAAQLISTGQQMMDTILTMVR